MSAAGRQGQRGSPVSEEHLRVYVQALLDHPRQSQHSVARAHGIAPATLWGWANSTPPNDYLARWLSESNNLAQLEQKRPRIRIGAGMRAEVSARRAAQSIPTEPHDREVVPIEQPSGDWLALRETILCSMQHAQLALSRAHEVVAAIDLIREALADQAVIKKLETQVAQLQNQVALADAQAKQFRSDRLRASQIVHSTD